VCATKKVCRYHPTEVQQGMAALARAQEQLQAACAAAWSQALRDFTASHHAAFRAAVDAVAQLDALHALAVVASSPGYCRPQVRHPRVALQALPGAHNPKPGSISKMQPLVSQVGGCRIYTRGCGACGASLPESRQSVWHPLRHLPLCSCYCRALHVLAVVATSPAYCTPADMGHVC
jgi:hypothetical protein